MPKIPNPFDKPKGKMGRKLLPRKDPKPFGNYGQGPNMPSNRLPKPAKRKGPKAGADTRPTEREPKRVAPRQRMPKELESMMPPKRGIRPMPKPRRPKPKPRPMPYKTPRRKKP